MTLRDEAGDPWGLLLGALIGGVAWAIGVPVVLAFVIGVAVYAVRVVSGIATAALTGRRAGPAELAAPPRGSAAGQLLSRAVSAVREIRDQAGTLPAGPSHDQLTTAVAGASSALDGLRRLAAQAAAMDSALARLNRPRLEAEYARLRKAVQVRASDDVREELQRSVTSVSEQIAVYDRLMDARASLLARAESATLGLEGLVARVVEVVALSTTAGGVDTVTSKIHDLASELDGLRQGLAETEALSRKAIAGAGTTPDVLPEQGGRQLEH